MKMNDIRMVYVLLLAKNTAEINESKRLTNQRWNFFLHSVLFTFFSPSARNANDNVKVE